MGRIVVVEFMSLDGVVQAPGHAQEDPEGFPHGRWPQPFFEAHRRYMPETLAAAGAYLFGRCTFGSFAAYRPTVTDPDDRIASAMNTRPKYVVPQSLGEPAWEPTTVLSRAVPDKIAALKAEIAVDLPGTPGRHRLNRPIGHRTKEISVQHITSHDGTTIGYTAVGDGPPLILVDGAFGSRAFGPNESLAALLADRFTVVTYDRRGRGDSNDLTGYGPGGVLREVDDLATLVDAVGGSAHLYGISSGAALALEAATRGVPVTKLALFEAPFIIDDSRPPVPDGYPARMRELLAADRRGKAVATFMSQGIGLNPAIVLMMRLMPAWSAMKGVAHTLNYDVDVTFDLQRGHPLPAARWSELTCPVLVVDGGKSPTWMRHAMAELAAALPNAEYVTLPGQTHLVKASVLAPELIEFFTSTAAAPPAGSPPNSSSEEPPP